MSMSHILLRTLSSPSPLVRGVRFITPALLPTLRRLSTQPSTYTSAQTPPLSQSKPQSLLERIKNPSRGGRNLRDRYRTLERSLRGKQARSHEVESLEHSASAAGQTPSLEARYDVNMFHGFKVPEEPKPPADDECCMSGCAVCVYDLYEESLQAYKSSLTTLRASLTGLGIPESQWPASIQASPFTSTSQSAPGKRQEAVMSAFEQMEMALKVKHAAQSQTSGVGPRQTSPAASAAGRGEGGKGTSTIIGESDNESVNVNAIGKKERTEPPGLVEWRKRRARIVPEWKEVVEGVRWLVFSNR